jgi:hypothetical protein
VAPACAIILSCKCGGPIQVDSREVAGSSRLGFERLEHDVDDSVHSLGLLLKIWNLQMLEGVRNPRLRSAGAVGVCGTTDSTATSRTLRYTAAT